MAKPPHYHHQMVCNQVSFALTEWNKRVGAGRVIPAPGIVFAVDEAVVPDVAWISHEQYAVAHQADGKLHAAPELMVEVLSFGGGNEEWDKALKLELYSRRGVREYWILDSRTRQVDVYRRRDAVLRHEATLYAEDTLTAPLLPGFTASIAEFFEDIPISN